MRHTWDLALLDVLVLISACGAETGVETIDGGGNVTETEPAASAPFVVSGGGANLSDPAIAIDVDGIVHVAWVEGLTSEAHIIHRYLPPGEDWSETETLSEGLEYNNRPRLLVAPDGHACVIWQASVPESALYCRCFVDVGWSAVETEV